MELRQFVSQAVAALRETTVKVATVVNYPDGNDSLAVVITALAQAMEYMALAESILGATFVAPKTFRIGASQLAV